MADRHRLSRIIAWRPVAFPLLAKELQELSARRRTYVLRSVFALILLGCFLIAYSIACRGVDPMLGMLGRGRPLFDLLFWTLSIGILLIMPAITGAVITQEKEQGSLTALLLTPMGPWEILLQKYASGVFAMFGVLLLGLPLFATCYAFGGVEIERVWIAVYVLSLTCLQVGAVSVMVSAWCRSSTAAIFASYVLVAALYLVQPIYLACESSGPLSNIFGENFLGYHRWREGAVPPIQSLCPLISYRLPELQNQWYNWYSGSIPASPADAVRLVLVNSGCAVASVVLILLAARIALVRRADVVGMNQVLRGMLALDRWFVRLDARIGRKARADLPTADPVAWRELNRRSLANWRYLFRIFIPIGLVVLILGTIACVGFYSHPGNIACMSAAVLGMSALALLVLGTGLVASERTQQTLDVLLSTPLSARTVLNQKARPLRRIHAACAVVMLMLLSLRLLFLPADMPIAIAYVLLTATMLPAVLWLGILAGIVAHRRARAVTLALALCAAWMFGIPLITLAAMVVVHATNVEPLAIAMHVSPLGCLAAIEPGSDMLDVASAAIGDESQNGQRVGLSVWHMAVTVGSCMAVWIGVSAYCRARADRHLRRGGNQA